MPGAAALAGLLALAPGGLSPRSPAPSPENGGGAGSRVVGARGDALRWVPAGTTAGTTHRGLHRRPGRGVRR